jgi:hypothetical protein
MKTPFTVEQFLELFKKYNIAVWPIQIVFYLLAICAIVFLIRKNKVSDFFISSFLAFLWLWIGIVYHLIFFTTINKAAYVFGILFILQSIIILVFGVFRNTLAYQYKKDIFSLIGGLLLSYALIFYPILGYYLGHQYPYSPTFGLPCPTVIFTFGILLFSRKKISYAVMIIPLLWSILGFFASISFGILEDIGLLLSGIIGIVMLVKKNKGFEKIKHTA